MEQRRLRLGDILDDYCPRERRVTNHVIVAMIEDDVKQTRCSTCDADHEYKQARVPAARRKKDAGPLPADMVAEAPRARRADLAESVEVPEESPMVERDVTLEAAAGLVAADVLVADVPEAEAPADEREDDGHVHRRLIRATLPRPEGQALERKATDFTVRQQSGRGGEIDGNRPHGQNRHHRPPRPGGDRPGDVRLGGSPQGNNPRGGGRPNNRGGQSPQGQPGGNPGGQRSGGPGGGEGRFRRRRGR